MHTGSLHDFDFLVGRWSVDNRRLVGGDWTTFPATSHCTPHLGGVVNIDEISFPTLGFAGLTLRAFDIAAGRWSIWWINSRHGQMLPPVQGGFSGEQGLFYGEDIDAGAPVGVRFLWTRQGAGAARWEQSFLRAGSDDWQTNWTMDFTQLC